MPRVLPVTTATGLSDRRDMEPLLGIAMNLNLDSSMQPIRRRRKTPRGSITTTLDEVHAWAPGAFGDPSPRLGSGSVHRTEGHEGDRQVLVVTERHVHRHPVQPSSHLAMQADPRPTPGVADDL